MIVGTNATHPQDALPQLRELSLSIGFERARAHRLPLRLGETTHVKLFACRKRKLVELHEARGNHVERQRFGQVRLHPRSRGHAVPRHVRAQRFASVLLVVRHHRRRTDPLQLQQPVLDLSQLNAVPANLHLAVDAPEKLDFAKRIPAAHVARAVKTLPFHEGRRHEALGRQLGTRNVSPAHASASNVQLTWNANRNRIEVRVQNVDAHAVHGPTYVDVDTAGHVAARGRNRHFGRSVEVRDARRRNLLDAPQQLGRKHVGPQSDLPNPSQRMSARLGRKDHLHASRRDHHKVHALFPHKRAQVVGVVGLPIVGHHERTVREQADSRLHDVDVERHWPHAQHPAAGGATPHRAHRQHEVGNLRMFDHHALRRAGRARRVDEVRRLAGIGKAPCSADPL